MNPKIFSKQNKAQTLVSVLLYLTIFAVIATIATIIVVNIVKQSTIQESQNKAAIFAQEKLKQLVNSQEDLFLLNGSVDVSKVFAGTNFSSCVVSPALTGNQLKCNLDDTANNQKIVLTCDKTQDQSIFRLKVNKDESIILNPQNIVTIGFEDVDNVQIDLIYTAQDTISNKDQTKIFTNGVSLTGNNGFGFLQGNNISWPNPNLNLASISASNSSFTDQKLQSANIKNIIKIDSNALLTSILNNKWNNSEPSLAGSQALQLLVTPISSDGTFTIEDDSGQNFARITCEAIATQTDTGTGGNSTSAKYQATILKYGTRLGILNYGLGIYKVKNITNPANKANLVK